MFKNRQKKNRLEGNFFSENGLLSLEACIVVFLFIFMMLFLYSHFVFFEARNEMAHVLLAATNSLSLDTYEKKGLENSGNISQLITKLYHVGINDDKGFVNYEPWNQVERFQENGFPQKAGWDGSIWVPSDNKDQDKEDIYGKCGAESSLFEQVIRGRIVAYLADGDETKADSILKSYHIEDGLKGLNFSGSHIQSGKIYVTVRYSLGYEFDVFGLRKLQMEQSACSKLW